MSIGFASAEGKTWIHTAGKITTIKETWKNFAPQDNFLESMTEACQSIVDYFKPENLAYVNVANKMSIDCHCDPNPHPPELADKMSIDCDCDPNFRFI